MRACQLEAPHVRQTKEYPLICLGKPWWHDFENGIVLVNPKGNHRSRSTLEEDFKLCPANRIRR
jgi:hypothetical protein